MRTGWKTSVGDEWWYTAPDCHAEASYTSIYPPRFHIGRVSSAAGSLTAEMLHKVLWSARGTAADEQLLLELDSQTTPLIESLATRGLVRWELITQQYSRQARVLEVLPPA